MATITDHQMPRGHTIFVLSLAVWWAKLEKNDKIRHNNTCMIQIATCSLLVVVTIFIWLMVCNVRGGGGDLYVSKNYLLYSRKYWRELNLAVEPKITIARILVKLKFGGSVRDQHTCTYNNM